MKPTLIMAPVSIVAASSSAGANANDAGSPATALQRPDPREAFFQTGGGVCQIDLDFGANIVVDTLFVGYVGGAPGATLAYSYGVNGGSSTDTPGPTAVGLVASTVASPLYRHFVIRPAAALTLRYLRLNVNSQTSGTMSIGSLGIGQAFVPQWGSEYGAGRALVDTGSADRLFGGGFNIDAGFVAGGYAFTLGDLQAPEREALYRLVRNVGQTRTALVLENSDTNDPINEGVHWGLFTKLEAYERIDALNTKWGLQILDWA